MGNSADYLDQELSQLITAVKSTRKYQNITTEVIRRIGQQELLKRKNTKIAIKETKNTLHQVSGSYFHLTSHYSEWLTLLTNSVESGQIDQIKLACLYILGFHQSTAERKMILDGFYQAIFDQLTPIKSILDLACGYNPLTAPWIPGYPGYNYYAVDIYSDLIEFIYQVLEILGIPGKAECFDILSQRQFPEADIVLLLKSIPCLEQIEKGSTLRLMSLLSSKYILASFPTRSLGGKNKRMGEYYTEYFTKVLKTVGWDYQIFSFSNEIAFLVSKK